MYADSAMWVAWGYASVSIQWDIHICNYDNGKLTWTVKRPASNYQVSMIVVFVWYQLLWSVEREREREREKQSTSEDFGIGAHTVLYEYLINWHRCKTSHFMCLSRLLYYYGN